MADGLLDTSVVVLLDRVDPEHLPLESTISALTLAELGVGPLVADDPQERALRQVRLQEAEAAFDPLPFDAAVARVWSGLSAQLRREGRTGRARTLDVLIAATAKAHGLPLHTVNAADVRGLDGLDVVEVPHPDRDGG